MQMPDFFLDNRDAEGILIVAMEYDGGAAWMLMS